MRKRFHFFLQSFSFFLQSFNCLKDVISVHNFGQDAKKTLSNIDSKINQVFLTCVQTRSAKLSFVPNVFPLIGMVEPELLIFSQN